MMLGWVYYDISLGDDPDDADLHWLCCLMHVVNWLTTPSA